MSYTLSIYIFFFIVLIITDVSRKFDYHEIPGNVCSVVEFIEKRRAGIYVHAGRAVSSRRIAPRGDRIVRLRRCVLLATDAVRIDRRGRVFNANNTRPARKDNARETVY